MHALAVTSGSGPNKAIAASSALTVRCLAPYAGRTLSIIPAEGMGKQACPARSGGSQSTHAIETVAVCGASGDSSLRPKPHNARPIFTRASAASCCALTRGLTRVRRALRQHPCATLLPSMLSRVPDEGPRPQPDKAVAVIGGRLFLARTCHASARCKPLCCASCGRDRS